MPIVTKLNGNNQDYSSSMFWEVEFDDDGREFELELKYGTVILTAVEKEEKNEIIVGSTSDFPDVNDVISVFKNWVATDPEELN